MRISQRAATVSALAALTVTFAATAASAHVTANPATAEPDSYSKISFRVPNEEPSGDTTKVELTLPADHPIASTATTPKPAAAPAHDDGTARLLGGLGLAAGIIGILVGAYGLTRRLTS